VAGLVTTFGAGAMTNSIREIRDADFLLVIGSNTTEAHPVIAMEMKRAVHRGATLVVADPRAIWLTRIAKRHLPLKPGTDVRLLNAMAHVIVEERLYDKEFIEEHTEGFEALRANVAAYPPEEAEKITGVPAEAIRATAREYATTKRAGIYYTLGITEHTHGTDNVYGLSNLVLLTGHLGQPSAGLNPLRGQNNVQGANDAGASPIFYPGYQRADDEEARRRYEMSWGVNLPTEPGLNLNQMMKVLGESIRGLVVVGEDLVISEPNVRELEERLEQLDHLVLVDLFLNETSKYADVVLPAACFAEKDGVFTNSERRVQLVRKAVDAPGQARPDWQILTDLANACGASWSYSHPSEVFDEMARDTEKLRGISHARIEERGLGLQWPCPEPDHPGTKFLHEGQPLRASGRALLQSVAYRPSSEGTSDAYPLILSTGRTLYHYNAATQTRRAEGSVLKQPEGFVEIHRRDARDRGIGHGDIVEVRSPRGAVECRAVVTRHVSPGRIWMPLHFAEARANLLTTDAGDAVTGTAEYKVCASQVTRVSAASSEAAPFRGHDASEPPAAKASAADPA
jgi:formate dehydrogenase major subunit/formate dehydrogenase alpha subunit